MTMSKASEALASLDGSVSDGDSSRQERIFCSCNQPIIETVGLSEVSTL